MNILTKLICLITCLTVSCSFGQTRKEFPGDCDRVKIGYQPDSLTRQFSLDSVSQLSAGHWRLMRIEFGNRLRPHKKLIEMELNANGQAIIFEEGLPVTSCQFYLTIPYGYVTFKLDEKGLNYFTYQGNRGGLGVFQGGFRVCEEKLILYDFRGETLAYIFERVK